MGFLVIGIFIDGWNNESFRINYISLLLYYIYCILCIILLYLLGLCIILLYLL